jgi:hypothetical protein
MLTNPDNGVGVQGRFPPLFWEWNGQLADDEYFEIRIWHESITTYRPALGWVKIPQFDYNISGEQDGKYYWTVVIVKDENVRLKDWYKPEQWPYPVWEHDWAKPLDSIQIMSQESEPRFFIFTPDKRNSNGGGSSISDPCPPGPGGC